MTRRISFRLTLIPACLIALALALLATPASAAEDLKGWMIAVDLALTQPEGLDSDIATVNAIAATPPTSERVTMDMGHDTTWRAAAGYNLGLGKGQVKVSYWTFDNDDTQNFSKAGFISPALFGYGHYGYMLICNMTGGGCNASLPVAFTGKTGLKAHTWDLDYSRRAEVTDKFGLRWLAGLRSATFEENQSFSGFDGTYSYLQDRGWNSDAFGLRVGGEGLFGISKHFGMVAGVAWSEMMGSTTGEASQTFPDGGSTCGSPPCHEIATGHDDHLHGSILDLSLKGVWSAGPVDISMGFTSSTWSGFVASPVHQNGFLSTSESPVQDSIGFSSFEVGVIWRIGGGQSLASP